ncbi:uncharacterized protein SCODWIG_00398 [Saccharomycodes ludwigii]|uniref:Telomerase reverse transcriptase n=1 Tax=Saccharomycodes ludwigii TaxID=36035 RepID=A0A376B1U5_9ASCO|nr:uncharacterized protein SCODWIG_00398 [Saccharomycodes ludwigii]
MCLQSIGEYLHTIIAESTNINKTNPLILNNVYFQNHFLNCHYIVKNKSVSYTKIKKLLSKIVNITIDTPTPIDINLHCQVLQLCYRYLLLNISLYKSNLLLPLCKEGERDFINYYYLNNIYWFYLHQVVGSANFLDILLNYSVFFYHNDSEFIQISGNKFNKKYHNTNNTNSSSPSYVVSPNLFMYKLTSTHKDKIRFIIPEKTPLRLLRTILSSDANLTEEHTTNATGVKSGILASDKILSKCKNLKHFLSKIQKQHKSLRYTSIFNNICPKRHLENTTDNFNHLANQVPIRSVEKFILVLIEKIFPKGFFGSNKNKSVIFKNITHILRLKTSDKIPLPNIPSMENINSIPSNQFIFQKIKINEFPWIYKYNDKNNNNHRTLTDFQFNRFLALKFFKWFYCKFLTNLISTFFYCSEVSSNLEVLFFRHDVWFNMVRPVINKYIKDYLLPNNLCAHNIDESREHDFDLFLHGNIRILPKSSNNEYRILCVPSSKGQSYWDKKKLLDNYIIPTRTILKQLRYAKHNDMDAADNKNSTIIPILSSLYQIAPVIRRFKETLLNTGNNKSFDKLHFLKFDIKSCYDSIPRNKIYEVLDDLLDDNLQYHVKENQIALLPFKLYENSDFNQSQIVHKTEYYINGASDYARTNTMVSTNNRNNLKIIFQPSISDDLKKRHFFTKEDIIYIVEKDVLETAMSIGNKCFLRKLGIYQGSYLSSTVVDLLYNDLLSQYSVFRSENYDPGTNTLVIRFADDFLVITNNLKQINDIEECCKSGFAEYNAFVNKDKLEKSDPLSPFNFVSFCGLNIDVDRLEIHKQIETINTVDYKYQTSAKIVYSRLLNLLQIRLAYKLLDMKLNSEESILQYIITSIINILDSFTGYFKKNVDQLHVTKYFGDFTTRLTTLYYLQ